jgi:hypothetical protein
VRTGYVQAPAFDLADEVLEEVQRQPNVSIEEEDQIPRSGVASEVPATRDRRLAVEDRGARGELGYTEGRVAGACVNDDDFLGSSALPPYI